MLPRHAKQGQCGGPTQRRVGPKCDLLGGGSSNAILGQSVKSLEHSLKRGHIPVNLLRHQLVGFC